MTERDFIVIAVDFDGTLCESMWPWIGSPNMLLIDYLIDQRNKGNKVILWTCRTGGQLERAVEWCKNYGLEFDAVNENLPEMIEYYGNDTRKIGYDILIDDRAANNQEFHVPYREKGNIHR